MQGVTAEYGPARAQKNQTGKWYPQIPVDHTTLQINQRVVNTTLIPVKLEHCQAVEKADPAKRKFADREEWKSVLAVLQQDGKLTVGAGDIISLPVPAEE